MLQNSSVEHWVTLSCLVFLICAVLEIGRTFTYWLFFCCILMDDGCAICCTCFFSSIPLDYVHTFVNNPSFPFKPPALQHTRHLQQCEKRKQISLTLLVVSICLANSSSKIRIMNQFGNLTLQYERLREAKVS